MKLYGILIFTIIFSTTFGCNQFKSDHPQSDLKDENSPTNLTSKSILQYADSINKNLNQYTKSSSLVYMLGDLSFYVDQYNEQNHPVLLVEHAYNGGESNSLKKYYFKNDSLILLQTNTELANEESAIFKDDRIYLRNNTLFKKDGRTAVSATAIKNLPYIDIPLVQTSPDQIYLENVSVLKDVLAGQNKFDMVFESIRTFPDSRYIILRSKAQNSYTASILVKSRDHFIDSLLNYPNLFKDKKLDFNWEVKDREAVYIPKP